MSNYVRSLKMALSYLIGRQDTSYHDRNTAIKKSHPSLSAYKRGLSAPPPQSDLVLGGSMTFLHLLLIITLTTSLVLANPFKELSLNGWRLGGSATSGSCRRACTSDNDCRSGPCNTCNDRQMFSGFIFTLTKGACGPTFQG